MSNVVLEGVLKNIESEIEVLRRDKESFLSDISNIDEEIQALLDDKVQIELGLVEDNFKKNELTDNEVNQILDSIYAEVAIAIAVGVSTLSKSNGDYDENSSFEHVVYAAKERTKWITSRIVERLNQALDNIVE